jgi:hypothetical protein
MLNVDRAEFHSFSVILSVAMLSVAMLSVVMLSVALLSVAMLSVIMLNVVMMNVVAPLWYLILGKLQPHYKTLYLNESHTMECNNAFLCNIKTSL